MGTPTTASPKDREKSSSSTAAADADAETDAEEKPPVTPPAVSLFPRQALCLSLAAFIALYASAGSITPQTLPPSDSKMSPTLPGMPRAYRSPSLHDQAFAPASCANMSRLPYEPAQPPGVYQPCGMSGFVLVSAHRLSSRTFAVLGVTPLEIQSMWGTYQEICLWVSYAGPTLIQGDLQFHFLPEEGEGHTYTIMVIHCNLTRYTPKDAGGALFINIQQEEALVYRELPGKRLLQPPTPLPSVLTVCSTLLRADEVGAAAGERMVEHMKFMGHMGADGFAVYDAGALGPELAAALVPFAGAGLLEIIDFHAITELSVDAGSMAANDCAFRMRFKASWVIILAPNEYPHMATPRQQLSQLMREFAGVPWLSLGVYVWYTEMCVDLHDFSKSLLEKMLWRKFNPECFTNGTDSTLCLGRGGIRRLLFDPRRVGLLTEHAVVFPSLDGIDLKTSDVVIAKFPGLLEPGALTCEYPVGEGHITTEWEKDEIIRNIVHEFQKKKQSFGRV